MVRKIQPCLLDLEVENPVTKPILMRLKKLGDYIY